MYCSLFLCVQKSGRDMAKSCAKALHRSFGTSIVISRVWLPSEAQDQRLPILSVRVIRFPCNLVLIKSCLTPSIKPAFFPFPFFQYRNFPLTVVGTVFVS